MIPFPAAMAIVVGRASAIRASFTRLPVGLPSGARRVARITFCARIPWCCPAANGTTLTRPQFKLEDPHSIYLLYYDETAQIRDGYIYVEKVGEEILKADAARAGFSSRNHENLRTVASLLFSHKHAANARGDSVLASA
jgi:hypothetical protein